MTFKRSTSTVGNHRNTRLIAEFQDAGDFLVGLGEDDNIGQRGVLHAFAVTVVLAHGVGGDSAVTVGGLQRADRGVYSCFTGAFKGQHNDLLKAPAPSRGGLGWGWVSLVMHRAPT